MTSVAGSKNVSLPWKKRRFGKETPWSPELRGQVQVFPAPSIPPALLRSREMDRIRERREVWSDEAQDCPLSRLLVSKVPGISCRVRDVAEVCVILDVGLQRGAGVNTASYIHSAISLSIKSDCSQCDCECISERQACPSEVPLGFLWLCLIVLDPRQEAINTYEHLPHCQGFLSCDWQRAALAPQPIGWAEDEWPC
ncbi:unnamed protein product [Leuciscus chuanchicus]